MTPLLSLIIIAAIIGLLLLLMLVDRGSRGSELSALADQLKLAYRPYASLSQRIRDAHFQLLDIGQFRHIRHLLEGQLENDDSRYLNLFDYSLIGAGGASTQTVILLPCPLPEASAFSICRKRWLQEDVFSESQHKKLASLTAQQKPLLLRQWQLHSQNGERLWALLKPEVCDWLLAHPHLHIEWADGILLLCRPHHVLPPAQIEDALQHALQLIKRLQDSARTV
jgi:hypothetical protein